MFEEIAKSFDCLKAPYHKAYDDMLGSFRDKEFKLLEIGIADGKSMSLWKEYFPKAKIYGIDNNETCLVNDDRVKSFCGDQSDKEFLKKIGEEHGKFDVIIDNGGHHCSQHLASYEGLFPYLSDGGYYIIEDVQTAYWDDYEGKPDGTSATVQKIKSLIDVVMAGGRWMKNFPDESVPISELHAYNGIIFIKKWKD